MTATLLSRLFDFEKILFYQFCSLYLLYFLQGNHKPAVQIGLYNVSAHKQTADTVNSAASNWENCLCDPFMSGADDIFNLVCHSRDIWDNGAASRGAQGARTPPKLGKNLTHNGTQRHTCTFIAHLFTLNGLKQTLQRRTTVRIYTVRSVITSLGTKNYLIQKWAEVQLLPQNAPEIVWRPCSTRTRSGSLQHSLIPFILTGFKRQGRARRGRWKGEWGRKRGEMWKGGELCPTRNRSLAVPLIWEAESNAVTPADRRNCVST